MGCVWYFGRICRPSVRCSRGASPRTTGRHPRVRSESPPGLGSDSRLHRVRGCSLHGPGRRAPATPSQSGLRFGVAGARRPGRQERTKPKWPAARCSQGLVPRTTHLRRRDSALRPLAPAGMCFRPFGRGTISTCAKAPADWPPATPDPPVQTNPPPPPKKNRRPGGGAGGQARLAGVSRGSSGSACRPRRPRPGSRSIGRRGCRCPSPRSRDRS